MGAAETPPPDRGEIKRICYLLKFQLFNCIHWLLNDNNRLVNGPINGLVGQLAARQPRLPIGEWPYKPTSRCISDYQ